MGPARWADSKPAESHFGWVNITQSVKKGFQEVEDGDAWMAHPAWPDRSDFTRLVSCKQMSKSLQGPQGTWVSSPLSSWPPKV